MNSRESHTARTRLLCATTALGVALAALWLLINGYGLIFPILIALAIIILAAARFPSFAWICYFLSISMTGAVLHVGPALVRAEMLALPLLVICVIRIKSGEGMTGVISRLSPRTLSLAIAYFAWASTTTAVNAPTPFPSLWILLQILAGFLAFASLRVSDEEKLKMIKSGSFVLGAIAGLSLLSWVARTYLGLPPGLTPGVAVDGRLIGFSFETNIFASQCVGWVALCSRWWRDLGRGVRIANVLLCFSVILAGTRAAWIALLFVMALSGFESARTSYKWFFGLIAGAGVALLTLPAFMQVDLSDRNSLAWRLGNLFSTDEGTGAYRAGIYETAIADIDSLGRALAGSGINSFSQFHLMDPTGVSASYLSSIWLAVLYDTGIVGLILFFGLIGSVVYSCHSRRDGIIVVVSLLICASATNLIWFQYPWIYLALLIFAHPNSTSDFRFRTWPRAVDTQNATYLPLNQVLEKR